MSPPHRARALAPLAVVALLVLAACGDDGGGGTDNTTTEAPSSTTSTTGVPTTTSTAPPGSTTTTDAGVDHGDAEEGLGDLEALVPQLLIQASELGPEVIEVGFRPDVDVDCTIDVDHPADVLAGMGMMAPQQAVEEVIRVFPSPEEAESAYDAWLAFAPDCTFGLGVPMGQPTDANDVIGADRSVVYSAARPGGGASTIVVALVSDSLVTTTVSGSPDLDPLEVGAFAVGKVLAALEA